MLAGWIHRYVAPGYRKPLGYALLLHVALLIVLTVNTFHRTTFSVRASQSVQKVKMVMINSVMTAPAAKPVKTKVVKHTAPIVHHKPSSRPHKKVAVKKTPHKKVVHKQVVHKVPTVTKATTPPTKAHKTAVVHKKTVSTQARHHRAKTLVHHKTVAPKQVTAKKAHITTVKKTKRAQPTVQKSVAKKNVATPVQKAVEKKKIAAPTQKTAATDSRAAVAANKPAPTISRAEINRYTAQITQAIGEHWIIPVGVAPSLSCRLDITVAVGGEVLAVSVVRSSGNPALDRSAVTAVLQASPLPVPSGTNFAPFRHIRLTVRPESVLSP